MKGKLTRVRTGKLKNIGYGSFDVSFALEWIPLLAPKVSVERWPHDPHMLKWGILMAHHGGGEDPTIRFTPNFFEWMESQIIMIEEFLYAGMDYTRDLDMPLPLGMQWGDRGETSHFG